MACEIVKERKNMKLKKVERNKYNEKGTVKVREFLVYLNILL